MPPSIRLYPPAPLDPRRHDRTQFDCGEPSLNEWLRRYAGQNRRGNTAATWVITDEDLSVAAYTTLSMTGIDLSMAPPEVRRQAHDPVPALLLGRLAVDRRYAGLGVGTALLGHVLGLALAMKDQAAFRAVTVHALNARARTWWERCGFSCYEPDDPMCMDLYLLTSDIESTLTELR